MKISKIKGKASFKKSTIPIDLVDEQILKNMRFEMEEEKEYLINELKKQIKENDLEASYETQNKLNRVNTELEVLNSGEKPFTILCNLASIYSYRGDALLGKLNGSYNSFSDIYDINSINQYGSSISQLNIAFAPVITKIDQEREKAKFEEVFFRSVEYEEEDIVFPEFITEEKEKEILKSIFAPNRNIFIEYHFIPPMPQDICPSYEEGIEEKLNSESKTKIIVTTKQLLSEAFSTNKKDSPLFLILEKAYKKDNRILESITDGDLIDFLFSTPVLKNQAFYSFILKEVKRRIKGKEPECNLIVKKIIGNIEFKAKNVMYSNKWKIMMDCIKMMDPEKFFSTKFETDEVVFYNIVNSKDFIDHFGFDKTVYYHLSCQDSFCSSMEDLITWRRASEEEEKERITILNEILSKSISDIQKDCEKYFRPAITFSRALIQDNLISTVKGGRITKFINHDVLIDLMWKIIVCDIRLGDLFKIMVLMMNEGIPFKKIKETLDKTFSPGLSFYNFVNMKANCVAELTSLFTSDTLKTEVGRENLHDILFSFSTGEIIDVFMVFNSYDCNDLKRVEAFSNNPIDYMIEIIKEKHKALYGNETFYSELDFETLRKADNSLIKKVEDSVVRNFTVDEMLEMQYVLFEPKNLINMNDEYLSFYFKKMKDYMDNNNTTYNMFEKVKNFLDMIPLFLNLQEEDPGMIKISKLYTLYEL